MIDWGLQASIAFDGAHEWPAAVRAAVLLHRRPLVVWYVDGLASAAGASRATLDRSFRRTYHTTPQKYQSLLRLRRTAEILRNDPGSSEGVVLSAGWPSLNEFARTLRRLTGLPVTAIRDCTGEELDSIMTGPLALPVPHL